MQPGSVHDAWQHHQRDQGHLQWKRSDLVKHNAGHDENRRQDEERLAEVVIQRKARDDKYEQWQDEPCQREGEETQGRAASVGGSDELSS